MLVLILFFPLLKTTQASGCRTLPLLQCTKDKALLGHVIKTKQVPQPGNEACEIECFMEENCISYNLGLIQGQKRLCELNALDHTTAPTRLDTSDKAGYSYCPIMNPCSSNPCDGGKMCLPDFRSSSYRCNDGMWEAWGAWSDICQVPRVRYRKCRNPFTQVEANDCIGSSSSKLQSPACSNPASLGLRIGGKVPDAHFKASSQFDHHCYPKYGRLNDKGWCSKKQAGEWLQVDLGSVKTITSFLGQGRQGNDQWVRRFYLQYRSNLADDWKNYDGGLSSCAGSYVPFNHSATDRHEIITTPLPQAIVARYVKVVVRAWHSHPSFRIDMHGC